MNGEPMYTSEQILKREEDYLEYLIKTGENEIIAMRFKIEAYTQTLAYIRQQKELKRTV